MGRPHKILKPNVCACVRAYAYVRVCVLCFSLGRFMFAVIEGFPRLCGFQLGYLLELKSVSLSLVKVARPCLLLTVPVMSFSSSELRTVGDLWTTHTTFNPIKPTISYMMHEFLRPLNHQHYQNLEKPVVHNLLHAFCWMIVKTFLRK